MPKIKLKDKFELTTLYTDITKLKLKTDTDDEIFFVEGLPARITAEEFSSEEGLELVGSYSGETLKITSNGYVDLLSKIEQNRNIPLYVDIAVPQTFATIEEVLEINTSNASNIIDVSDYHWARLVDANLVPENIAEGVNLLGVTGKYPSATFIEDRPLLDLKTYIEGITSTERLFNEDMRSNLDFLQSINFSHITDMSSMFSECANLITIPMINTSNVTDMNYMFSSCPKLETIPALDTQNVTTMDSMFMFCSSLTEIPLLNTSNVTNMRAMFNICRSLTTIPQLDTSKVTNMHYMFSGCSNLTSIPQLNTSNVISMGGLFFGCKIATIPQLNTSKVKTMSEMFKDCSSLISIPQLDTSNVTNMSEMFYNCSNLQTIPLLNTSNVTNMNSMFENCSSLTEIPQLDTSKVTYMVEMFYGCSNLQTVPQLNTANVTTMERMFRRCNSLTTIPQLNTSKVTSMSGMFEECDNLTTIPLLDTNKVTNMSALFANSNKLSSIPQLDTSKVTNMNCMFLNCYNLTSIPQLDTSNVTNMENMFNGCASLTAVPPLDTSKVVDMGCMFLGCKSLTTIPPLNTSKVTDMNRMFASCNNLESVDLSYYNVGNADTKNEYMFSHCNSLKEIIIRSFGDNYAIKSEDSFTNCYHLTGTVNETYNPNGDKDCWIRVPDDMVDTLRSASGWSTYASQIIGFDDVQVLDDVIAHTEAQTKNMTIRLYRNTNAPTSVIITSNNETITTITNIVTSTDRITFDLNFTGTIGDSVISVNVVGDNSAEYTFRANFIEYVIPTYTVEAVEGATYGFELKADGYYESTNKGIHNSYSLCKVVFNNSMEITTPITLDCINYAERNCDYGILSNLDTTLTLSSNADSSNVYNSFKALSSSAVQQVTYEIPSGEHFIYIKYRKDGSGSPYNDSFKFKINS